MTSSIDIFSPPVNVYSESHQRQRRLQPVSRTKTQGRPAWVDSPWMLKKISVIRIGCLECMPSEGSEVRDRFFVATRLRSSECALVADRVLDTGVLEPPTP